MMQMFHIHTCTHERDNDANVAVYLGTLGFVICENIQISYFNLGNLLIF